MVKSDVDVPEGGNVLKPLKMCRKSGREEKEGLEIRRKFNKSVTY